MYFDRVGENLLAFPLIANTTITYCSIVFLGSVFFLSCSDLLVIVAASMLIMKWQGFLSYVWVPLVLSRYYFVLAFKLCWSCANCYSVCCETHVRASPPLFFMLTVNMCVITSSDFNQIRRIVSWNRWFGKKLRAQVSSLLYVNYCNPSFLLSVLWMYIPSLNLGFAGLESKLASTAQEVHYTSTASCLAEAQGCMLVGIQGF